jgi:hypothetical protein
MSESALRWLSLLVAALTLVTLWESHQLHKLEFEERCERRRLRQQGVPT